MELKQARTEHLEALCRITDQAKKAMHDMGIDQWTGDYPSRAQWEQDIQDGCTYVALLNGAVVGAFAYATAPDDSYAVIDGTWLTPLDAPYASFHRVCVAAEAKGQGVAGQMFAFGSDLARADGFASVRIDTHPDNLPMQRALAKAGFVRCGDITLVWGPEAGDPRIGYEKMLEVG